jgi:DNA invertase Pin-like site-specific DNA recombinase
MAATTSTKTIRAAVYLRQSLDKNGDLLAVTRQREAVRDLCQRRDWTMTEYVDNDFSASVRMPGSRRVPKKRPAYEQMLADITAGKIDAIAAWDADRLYRHPRELEDLIDLADQRGLELATIGGDFDLATPTGRGNARMKGVFARMEMEQKSARQKLAFAQRAKAKDGGRPWWPSRPFGYDADPDPVTGRWSTRGGIRLHPTEAKLLRVAYAQFNAGASIRSLAARWNENGVTTPKGGKWTPSAVHHLLAAARNAGLREYDGQVVGKGTWPAIVDEDTWHAALGKLKDPARRNGPSRARQHLLSNIARCGVCDAPLSASKNSRKVRQYVCANPGCRKISRGAEKVDEVIIEAVVGRLSREDAVDLLKPPIDPVDVSALRAERKTLNERLIQLGKDFASAPPAFTQAALAEIDGRLAEINAQLEDPGKARIFEGVIGAKDVRKAFLGLDLGRRRTIVDALMAPRIKPVGRKAGKLFNAEAIDPGWKE